jgi:MFS family permease
VREGKYPDPPPYVGRKTGLVAAIKTCAKECHCHPIYWYLWLASSIGWFAGGVGSFDLFFKQSIGLDLHQIGNIAGTFSIVMSVLMVGAGWLADRYHPIRIILIAQIVSWVTVIPASFIWIFWQPGHDAAWTFHLPFLQHLPYLDRYVVLEVKKVFLISMLTTVGLAAPLSALTAMWDPVMLARIFPTTRLGQFFSVNAIWRSTGGMVGAYCAGCLLDLVAPYVGRDRAYCFTPLWSAFFGIFSFIMFLKFYQSWKRLGADAYVPPIIEEPPSAVAATPVPAQPGAP